MRNGHAARLHAGLLVAALAHGAPVAAQVIDPVFAGDYSLVSISSPDGTPEAPVPGIPAQYSGVAFQPGNPDRLFMAGNSNQPGAAIFSIGLTRDGAGHIDGLVNDAVQYSTAPGIANGMHFGPGGTLFYVANGSAMLGQILPGSAAPDAFVDLAAVARQPITSPAAISFVPQGFAGSGALKFIDIDGDVFASRVRGDGAGTYRVPRAIPVARLGVEPNNVATGLAWVSAGNPQFAQDSVLAATCDYNTSTGSMLRAYETDAGGNPVVASARVMVTGVCPTGIVVDPVTGDLLLATVYGFPNLVVLQGFTVAPPAAVFMRDVYRAGAAAGEVTVAVMRQGDTTGALAVDFATSPGTAVEGVNYTDTAGTLTWGPGETRPRRFRVALLGDGVHTGPLTVNLALTRAGDARTVRATLVLRDAD